MKYSVEIGEDNEIMVRNTNGELLRKGDMVYDPDLPQYPSRKIKKFFYPERSEVLYVQFDQGYGSNDGCLPVGDLTKTKPSSVKTK